MHKKEIRVTQERIDRGVKGNPETCPVGLSAQEDLKGVHLTQNDKDQGLPEDASAFIRDFDAGRPVKPFSFYLNVGS